MVGPVDEGDFYVNHGITGDDTVLHGLYDALLYRHHVFLGNRSADSFIHKLESLARLLRFQFNHRMPVLTAAASLTNIFAFSRYLLTNGFPIRHLGLADVC